jgi:hypothetical protein
MNREKLERMAANGDENAKAQLQDEHRPDGNKLYCASCGERLGIPGGMGGTDLCGPCCTGEAATLDEFGETW